MSWSPDATVASVIGRPRTLNLDIPGDGVTTILVPTLVVHRVDP